MHRQVYLHAYPKELVQRRHVLGQALRTVEVAETRTNSLVTPFQLWHAGAQKKILLKE